MSAEDVVAHMERVDRAMRNQDEVARSDRSINISGLYDRYGWNNNQPGPCPLPPDGIRKLQLVDRTRDDRWVKSFKGGRRFLGVFRSVVGYYWLLRFDSALSEHFLDHIGTAHDTDVRFGAKTKKK